MRADGCFFCIVEFFLFLVAFDDERPYPGAQALGLGFVAELAAVGFALACKRVVPFGSGAVIAELKCFLHFYSD